MNAAYVVGRAVFGAFFAYNGVNHFRNSRHMAGYAGSKGVPSPDAAVLSSGAMLLLGGASLLSGVKPKAGAALIVGFLGAVTPMMHDFWNQQDPAERQNQMIHFMKNLALASAAVAFMGERQCESLATAH